MARRRAPNDRAPGRPGPELLETDLVDIVTDPRAKKAAAKEAIRRAMAEDGLTRAEAREAYLVRDGEVL